MKEEISITKNTYVTPFFLIIVPVYNTGAYLNDTLASVVNQNYEAFHAFVVDNGSSDESAMISDSFAADAHISVFHEQKLGLGPARNYGVQKAIQFAKQNPGNLYYILFLDGDDCLEKNALALINCPLQKYKPDLFVFCLREEGLGEAFYESHPTLREGFITREEAANEIGVSACTKAYRLDYYISKKLFFRKMIHEDQEFVSKAICGASSIYYSPAIIYVYKQNPTSIMHNLDWETEEDRFRAFAMAAITYGRAGVFFPRLIGKISSFCIDSFPSKSHDNYALILNSFKRRKEYAKRWINNTRISYRHRFPLKLRIAMYMYSFLTPFYIFLLKTKR